MKKTTRPFLFLIFTFCATGGLYAAAAFAADAPSPVREHMRHMQDAMAEIHAEQDPARRAELMHGHHAMMQSGMDMLEQDDAGGMSMEERMTRMEERTDMMRMMMGHRVESHAEEVDPEPAHQHEQ